MKIYSIKDYPKETYHMLVNMKIVYRDNVKKIEEVIADGSSMELENIGGIAKDLCDLKHFGKQFKKLVNQFFKDNAKKMPYEERIGLDMSDDQ